MQKQKENLAKKKQNEHQTEHSEEATQEPDYTPCGTILHAISRNGKVWLAPELEGTGSSQQNTHSALPPIVNLKVFLLLVQKNIFNAFTKKVVKSEMKSWQILHKQE
jgi:hypothetical protein